MKEVAVLFISGVVAVAIITSFGLHAQGLAQVGQSAGTAGSGLIRSAEGK
jgi:hypothetical protein